MKGRTFFVVLLLTLLGIGGGIALAHYLDGRYGMRTLIREVPTPSEELVNQQESFNHIARFVMPSVVRISTRAVARNWWLEARTEGVGSGVLIEDGYLITNNHVVEGASQITVRFHNGKETHGTVVGKDRLTDLALIRVSEIPDLREVYPAKLGDSDKAQVGDMVLAIGSPFGLDQTVTHGIISALGRKREEVSIAEEFIQTDASINPGNSGGALVNLNGEVIGINTFILSKTGTYAGLGFAIPMNVVKLIKERLIKEGRIARGYLGIATVTIDQNLVGLLADEDIHSVEDVLKQLHLSKPDGAFVLHVESGTPASEAQFKVGDVVVEMNGQSVLKAEPFRQALAQTKPGTKVTFQVMRNGKPLPLTATLGDRAHFIQDEK